MYYYYLSVQPSDRNESPHSFNDTRLWPYASNGQIKQRYKFQKIKNEILPKNKKWNPVAALLVGIFNRSETGSPSFRSHAVQKGSMVWLELITWMILQLPSLCWFWPFINIKAFATLDGVALHTFASQNSTI